MCIRIDFLGAAFAAGLAAVLVYGRGGADPSDTGFSLNMAGKLPLLTFFSKPVAHVFTISHV